MTLTKTKKKLKEKHQIVVEGNTLIHEAIANKFKINHLLFSQFDKVQPFIDIVKESGQQTEFVKVPQYDLTTWSVLQTCPGTIALLDKPKVGPKTNALPVSIICDNIREPNNLGSIIRVSNAVPVKNILLPKGCTDPWDVKAIRGSSGSVFYMPVQESLTWNEVNTIIDTNQDHRDPIILIADNNIGQYAQSDVLNFDELPSTMIQNRPIFIVIGGETHGISDEAINLGMGRECKVINIPLDNTVNSLNTSHALAIILFELRRLLKT